MPIKPALSLSIETEYRSGLEKKVADQLKAAGVSYTYEGQWVRYVVPSRSAKYLPDFTIAGSHILLEAKGRFGGHMSDNRGAAERQKMILLKEQHPELDIRFVFESATKKIYKGSKTTYAKWAEDHGFKYADKGVVPKAWLDEMKLPTTS